MSITSAKNICKIVPVISRGNIQFQGHRLSALSPLSASLSRRLFSNTSKKLQNPGLDTGTVYADEITKERNESRRQKEFREEEERGLREKVLEASLPFVHEHGWSKEALQAGATAVGYPSVAHGMFSNGAVELVHYFNVTSNAELAKYLAEQVAQAKQTDTKIQTAPFIKDAIETRLKMIIPYIDTWPQAISLMLLPQNAAKSLSNFSHVLDDIWYYAGDRSTDFNWYTKRIPVAVIYKSTEIYMIQDRSENYQNTWKYLDRRLNQFVRTASKAKTVQQSNVTQSLTAAGITIKNILGFNSNRL